MATFYARNLFIFWWRLFPKRDIGRKVQLMGSEVGLILFPLLKTCHKMIRNVLSKFGLLLIVLAKTFIWMSLRDNKRFITMKPSFSITLTLSFSFYWTKGHKGFNYWSVYKMVHTDLWLVRYSAHWSGRENSFKYIFSLNATQRRKVYYRE